ncbi:MAG: hypothetical protein Q8Q38_00645 [bacterium]|nr:hypothetical protein [bacterium]
MVARKIKKRKVAEKKSSAYTGGFAVIFLGILIVLGYNNVRIQQKRGELVTQAEQLAGKVGELQAQEEKLKTQSLNAEAPEYQERILREQGLYKKEGEEVITVLPPEQVRAVAPKPERVWWNPWTWFK